MCFLFIVHDWKNTTYYRHKKELGKQNEYENMKLLRHAIIIETNFSGSKQTMWTHGIENEGT